MESYLEILFTILNIIKYLIYILIASAIVIFIFLKVSPAFGGIPDDEAQKTIDDYNNSIEEEIVFDPTVLDGKSTKGLKIQKSNWAQKLDKGPYKAYPVTGGITFTYGGLKVDDNGGVLNSDNMPIKGLFACGELIGGVFFNGYPGGSGLTSGAVFGRIAGYGSVR